MEFRLKLIKSTEGHNLWLDKHKQGHIQLDASDCELLFGIFSHFVLTATLENMAKFP
jgi:hypothetical protein